MIYKNIPTLHFTLPAVSTFIVLSVWLSDTFAETLNVDGSVADCSAAQPGAVRSPLILVCGTDPVERASRGYTGDCEH